MLLQKNLKTFTGVNYSSSLPIILLTGKIFKTCIEYEVPKEYIFVVPMRLVFPENSYAYSSVQEYLKEFESETLLVILKNVSY